MVDDTDGSGSDRYRIEGFAFVGRTFGEYARMFDLDVGRWQGRRLLDCPAGPCSFVPEARDRGVEAWAADLAYGPPPSALRERCRTDVDRAMAALDGVEHLYRWQHYDDVADLRSYRERAARRFLEDYPDHHVAARLPDLPFRSGAFDLVLSAHCLFLYDDRLDAGFHEAALRELARVGGEVRVFPLVGFDAQRYPHLWELRRSLHGTGRATEVREVPFEFQRGATEMLVVHGE